MVMDVDYFMHVCRRTMWFLLWWKLNKKYSDCFFIYKEKGHPMFTTASCPTNVRKKLEALLIFKTWACRNQDSPQSPSNKMSASFYCPISLQRRVRSAPWTAQEENGSIIAFNPLWINWLYFQTNMASIIAYCLHLQRVASLIYNINWTNRQLLYLFFWECKTILLINISLSETTTWILICNIKWKYLNLWPYHIFPLILLILGRGGEN